MEGLDRAYNNHENLHYDGNDNLFLAGTNSIQDLLINGLTIPLILIQYTDIYVYINKHINFIQITMI